MRRLSLSRGAWRFHRRILTVITATYALSGVVKLFGATGPAVAVADRAAGFSTLAELALVPLLIAVIVTGRTVWLRVALALLVAAKTFRGIVLTAAGLILSPVIDWQLIGGGVGQICIAAFFIILARAPDYERILEEVRRFPERPGSKETL